MIDRRKFLRLTGASAAGLTLSGALAGCGSNTATPGDAQLLVDESRIALQTLLASPELTQLPRYIRGAKAVLIAPELLRGGFIVGGRGGNAVMLVRLPDGNWSYPAFYGIGGGSLGLQIGGQVSQLVLTIMTDKGLRAVEQSSFTVGADLSGSLFTLGAGVGASTGLNTNADMYAFSQNKGLFAGGTLDGTVISEDQGMNDAYYGFGTPARIVFQGQRSNPGAESLRSLLPR
ncbi:lipid-binding SYLF domain-containing protein [Inquilinus limosus]|uniref:lipid-binding SYLF domain-containing protein n=1 Tax=Inquilinus limosus TaxID=171674 RepID=UPI0004124A22|nr:lipid-binding SYLF domain-containing protein [Inquilinus limosus]